MSLLNNLQKIEKEFLKIEDLPLEERASHLAALETPLRSIFEEFHQGHSPEEREAALQFLEYAQAILTHTMQECQKKTTETQGKMADAQQHCQGIKAYIRRL